jgi:hypothetical protein
MKVNGATATINAASRTHCESRILLGCLHESRNLNVWPIVCPLKFLWNDRCALVLVRLSLLLTVRRVLILPVRSQLHGDHAGVCRHRHRSESARGCRGKQQPSPRLRQAGSSPCSPVRVSLAPSCPAAFSPALQWSNRCGPAHFPCARRGVIVFSIVFL